jgi:hypothetical protein
MHGTVARPSGIRTEVGERIADLRDSLALTRELLCRAIAEQVSEIEIDKLRVQVGVTLNDIEKLHSLNIAGYSAARSTVGRISLPRRTIIRLGIAAIKLGVPTVLQTRAVAPMNLVASQPLRKRLGLYIPYEGTLGHRAVSWIFQRTRKVGKDV